MAVVAVIRHGTANTNTLASMSSRLFEPVQVGRCALQHRIAMAPMTRRRANNDYTATDLMREYYAQRATTPGTLLISEAVAVCQRAAVWQNTPGLYTDAQVAAWQPITAAIHDKGSYVFAQLWITGRAARPAAVAAGAEVVSSSDLAWAPDEAVPRPLREDEIWQFVEDYRVAARNAIRAGFDGVEIHGANGYLVDQFLQDTCNRRTDGWGGSVERRARFGLEVARAVVREIGADRVGFRISPFNPHHGMRMKDPVPQFTYLLEQLRAFPEPLAYLHIIEARVSGTLDTSLTDSIDCFVETWGNVSPVIVAGGYTIEGAQKALDGKYRDRDVLVAFGRRFISTPDLPFRAKRGIAWEPYVRATFQDVLSPVGYTDYPFSNEFSTKL
ncbi:hypothetical protein SCUCBS95973_003148 [Sporothrix curviconia]|uniref:NADH:flavin oxidoreductase/NADH oxidase N-terminal domain-containing protein n=1 Tax=Sporothrix curviconia TaxID=1260050 RepID=A0ABP0BCU2_9PEZI